MFILALILFCLVCISLWKSKQYMKRYAGEWLSRYIEDRLNLDVVWDGWDWSPVSSSANISGLRIRSKDEAGPGIWISIGRVEFSYNPFLLIMKKIVEIKRVYISDIKARFRFSGEFDPDDLDANFMAGLFGKSGSSAKDDSKDNWSFRFGKVTADGNELALDMPGIQGYLTVRDFKVLIDDLAGKGPYPLRIGFKEGELTYKGLYRIVDACNLEGTFDDRAIHIDTSRFNVPKEGILKWEGDLKREENGIFIDGRYSGELFCDTLAHFLMPFREMRGSVSSEGNIKGRLGQLMVDANVAAPEFFWRDFDFSEVKGRFNYHSRAIDFKGFNGLWRGGYINAESFVSLSDKKAAIKIHAEQLPCLSLFEGWREIFAIEPPVWEGDMEWDITWFERVVKSQGEVRLSAPLSIPERVKVNTRFHSQDDLILFKILEVIIGDNDLKAEGQYDILKKEAGLEYKCNFTEDGLISDIWRIPVSGTGMIKGSMIGPLTAPVFEGEIDAGNICIREYCLDTMAADYIYKKGRLSLENIKSRLSDAKIEARGYVSLPIPHDGLDLEFFWSAEGLPVSEVVAHTPFKPGFPYQEKISGDGHLRMNGGNVESKGSFSGRNVTLLGQPEMDIEAVFDVSQERLAFRDIKLKRGQSVLRGELLYNRGDGWLIKADSSLWRVSPILLSHDHEIPVEGSLRFDMAGSLKDLAGEFKAQDILYKGHGPWDISWSMGIKDRRLKAFILYPWGEGYLDMDLDEDIPFSMAANCSKFPVSDPSIGLVDPNSGISMIINGDLVLYGFLKRPISFRGRFKGNDMNIFSKFGRFESQMPYDILLKDGELSIPFLFIQSDEGRLEINGSWDIQGEFDINAVGVIPLNALQHRLSIMRGLSGQADLRLNLKGTRADPKFQGEIMISEGGGLVPQYNLRLNNIQGTIGLTQTKAFIKELSADARGGGWVKLRGSIGYQDFSLRSFDLYADFENIYIYKSNSYRTYLEGDLEWTGSRDYSVLSGNVLLKETRYTGYKNIMQLILAKKRDVETGKGFWGIDAEGEWDEFIGNTTLGIGLELGEDFWVRSPFYSATLTGDLLINGTLGAPWLYGDIDVVNGDVYIGSQGFAITSGRIKLTNPELSESTINAVAIKDINSSRLRLSIFGHLSDPKLQFSSTPYRSQSEILNMVFLGMSTEGEDRYQKESDILSLMFSTTGKVLDEVLGSDVSYYTGLDMLNPGSIPGGIFRFDILDLALQEEGGGLKRLTLGKTLSRRFKIKYSRLTGEEEREIAEAEYMITDHLTLIGAQDNQGTYSLDLNFGFRF
ncbi:translocation/assembly module TamB domain-containing protein [bacterium]|nr:translocation/assembly module TamB domain-containing protein [bacterium]